MRNTDVFKCELYETSIYYTNAEFLFVIYITHCMFVSNCIINYSAFSLGDWIVIWYVRRNNIIRADLILFHCIYLFITNRVLYI